MSLTNSQHNAIMRIYSLIKIKNQHLLEDRRAEVYSRCPQIKQIEDKIIDLSSSTAPLIIQGGKGAFESYNKQLNLLIEEKEKLMSEYNYPADYLSEIYDCPQCHDSGYVDKRPCACFKKKVVDLLYMQSNLKNIINTENFDTFSYDWYSKEGPDQATGLTPYNNMQNIVSICHNFIDTFDSEFSNLLFYGDTGIGKTFLSNCIASELLKTSHSVIYLTAIELFDIFASHDFSKERVYADNETMSDYIIDCDLLIIDDLGTELSNSFTNSKLFYCINERILKQKSTIISTNLSIKELSNTYSERVFSRISSSYKLLKFYGKDIRLQKKWL